MRNLIVGFAPGAWAVPHDISVCTADRSTIVSIVLLCCNCLGGTGSCYLCPGIPVAGISCSGPMLRHAAGQSPAAPLQAVVTPTKSAATGFQLVFHGSDGQSR